MKYKIKLDSSEFEKGAKRVSSGMSNLGRNAKMVDDKMSKMYANVKKGNKHFVNLSKDANRAGNAMKSLGTSVRSLNMLFGAGKLFVISNIMKDTIKSTLDMVEVNNLFAVSMGTATDSANEFVTEMSSLTGLDPTNLRSAVGTFGLLARSMGISGENSEILSTNLVKLSTDLSSLMNIPINQVMQDLRSGLVGQSETIYKYGMDITEASLKQEAMAQGIEKSVRNMSQGEKMALRYAIMIKKSALAHGDFARTLDTPMNQLRVLEDRLITLARSIGQLFLPALSAILPYLNAIVIVATRAVNALLAMFGIEAPKIPKYGDLLSGVKEDADDATDAIDKMGKAIKNATLGIDELNVIDKNAGKKSEDSGMTVGDPNLFKFEGYDAMWKLIKNTSDEIANRMIPKLKESWELLKEILLVIGLIGIATGIYALSQGMLVANAKTGLLLTSLKELWQLYKAFGLVEVLTLFPWVAKLGAVAAAIGKISLLAGGLYLAFKGVQTVLTESSPSWEGFALLVGGAIAIVAGLALMFAGIPLAIAGAIAAIGVAGVYLYKYWDEVVKFIKGVWDKIVTFTNNLLESISKGVTESIASLKQFLTDSLTNAVQFVTDLFGTIETEIPKAISQIVQFFSELPYKVGFALGVVIGTFVKWVTSMIVKINEELPKMINAIMKFFIELPSKIETAINNFRKTIENWVVNSISWVSLEVPKLITKIVSFFTALLVDIDKSLNTFRTVLATWIINAIVWTGAELPKLISKILSFFLNMPSKLVNVGIDMVTNLWNGINSMWSWLERKITNFVDGIMDVFRDLWRGITDGFNNVTSDNNVNITTSGGKSPVVPVSLRANGGFPSMGEMFIARESGPELVGSVNGRSAVVNNDQIVQAVAQGVAQAVASVMGQQQSQPIVLTLDGEVIYSNQQKVAKNRGVDFGMGAFAR